MYQDKSIVGAAADSRPGQDWQALAAVIAAAVRNDRAEGGDVQAGGERRLEPALR